MSCLGQIRDPWHSQALTIAHGLSQDLETGCPKLAIVKYLGLQYTRISTINMYKFIKTRHDILIQCDGNCMEMKKIKYMLEINILRNSSQIFWVSWGLLFKGLGVQKDTQTPCWLRPCYSTYSNWSLATYLLFIYRAITHIMTYVSWLVTGLCVSGWSWNICSYYPG